MTEIILELGRNAEAKFPERAQKLVLKATFEQHSKNKNEPVCVKSVIGLCILSRTLCPLVCKKALKNRKKKKYLDLLKRALEE